MKKISCIQFLILLSFGSSAQLNYAFTSYTGQYAPVSGNAPVLTVLTSDGGSGADEAYARVPIGFLFNYKNKSYDSIGISTNGFAYLGHRAPSTGMYTNSLSHGESAIRPIIAPLWDDLDFSTSADITYQTSGNAPERILTVQWSNAKWSFSSDPGVISFQLKCFEGTNEIKFVYENGPTAPFQSAASIGLSDSISGPENFLSVQSTLLSPGISAEAENISLSTEPTTGQVYSFMPAASVFIWTGNISTDWEDAGNWSGNTVPSATSTVIIPSARQRYPVISISTTVKSITCQEGASLTVMPPVVLNVLQ